MFGFDSLWEMFAMSETHLHAGHQDKVGELLQGWTWLPTLHADMQVGGDPALLGNGVSQISFPMQLQ